MGMGGVGTRQLGPLCHALLSPPPSCLDLLCPLHLSRAPPPPPSPHPPPSPQVVALTMAAALAGAKGLHMTASIGGADMPVVITLLNSYSGEWVRGSGRAGRGGSSPRRAARALSSCKRLERLGAISQGGLRVCCIIPRCCGSGLELTYSRIRHMWKPAMTKSAPCL